MIMTLKIMKTKREVGNTMTTAQIHEEIINSEVVASETLRYLVREGYDITDEQIEEALQWSGDDEYATVEDVRLG